MGESLASQPFWGAPAVSEIASKVVPESAVTDETLIRAVLDGDDRIAAELYDRLFPRIDRALCRVFGGRDRDHDDLVQSSFLQVVSSIASRKFNGRCPLSAWASAIATKVGLMALRSRCRERRSLRPVQASDVIEIAGPRYEIERQLEARDDVRRVQSALVAMSGGRAEVLLLHDVVGHELTEIAALTGASVAAVQSRLVRGRHELMERLGNAGDTEGDPR
ncbi:MAG TPA: RNA polymerase sigma factor [Polyangiaceae bacterium]